MGPLHFACTGAVCFHPRCSDGRHFEERDRGARLPVARLCQQHPHAQLNRPHAAGEAVQGEKSFQGVTLTREHLWQRSYDKDWRKLWRIEPLALHYVHHQRGFFHFDQSFSMFLSLLHLASSWLSATCASWSVSVLTKTATKRRTAIPQWFPVSIIALSTAWFQWVSIAG